MKFEIPDHTMNGLQRESLMRMLRMSKGAHYTNIEMRINGRNETFEADYLKSIVVTEEPAPDS